MIGGNTDPIKRFLAGLTCEEDARYALRTEGVSSYGLPDAFPTATPTTAQHSLVLGYRAQVCTESAGEPVFVYPPSKAFLFSIG